MATLWPRTLRIAVIKLLLVNGLAAPVNYAQQVVT